MTIAPPSPQAHATSNDAQTQGLAQGLAQSLEKDLKSCLRISEFVFQERSLDAFLRLVLEEAVRRVEADRGGIFLYERDENVLYGFAMTGVELSPALRLEGGKGIVGEVVRTGAVLNIADAYQDPRFYRDVDTLTGYRTRAIVCAPIVGSGEDKEVWGALELLNPLHKDTFDELDVGSLNHILAFAALRLKEHAKVERLLRLAARMETELAVAKGTASEEAVLSRLVGRAPCMERLRAMVLSVAPFDSNVLIQGESGTGKELVAQCVHALSARREKPFVALNCAAIPEALMEAELFGIESGVATGVSRRQGKLEQAQGGTLFLDEIGEMSLPTQAKLLRALQEREITRVGGKDSIRIDVRFVSATHRDLPSMIEDKLFREDLYYRLHVVHVTLPPLRERKGDVALLASHFLDDLNDRYTKGFEKSFAPGVLAKLETLPWRGNVRELHNEIERAFVLSGTNERTLKHDHFGWPPSGEHTVHGPEAHKMQESQSASHFKKESPCEPVVLDSPDGSLRGDELRILCTGKGLMEIVAATERLLVKASLLKNHGNKTKAAEALGISREGMRKMLARWGDDA